MENEQENLNTETNDIAGNRINGPIGNTAAQHSTTAGTGTPGTGAAPTTPDTTSPAAPASSESLADSETSVGQGAVDEDAEPQENKEANPADLQPGNTYGGNFSNSTQDSYRDEDRRENQDSDPNRGEFGVQSQQGTTHGGFGNQFREGITKHQGEAENKYYGEGVVRQDSGDQNAYRAYDGRDERPDGRTQYGFEASAGGANATGTAETGQLRGEGFEGPNSDNRNQPDRADANGAYQNDNGSAKGPDSGYAADYGHTSLRGAAATMGGNADQKADVAGADRRNQTEDYLPTPGDADTQGRKEQHPGYSTNAPEMADQRGQQPASSQGYGDRGRNEPRQEPDFQTGGDRTGYVQSSQGDEAKGTGSRGGSYNDAYDDSQPGSKAGSPAKGDERREDRSQNYGSAAREENRTGDDNNADHGAPQRNAGRDGEADE